MKYYNLSIDDTLHAVHSSHDGLSNDEVAKRQRRDGLNIVKVKSTPLWKLFVRPFANIMMAVLFLACILSIWHGNYADAIIIAVIILAGAVIDWAQEYSTGRILRSLREQEVDSVEVLRNGKSSLIEPSDLVVGDIVFLREGQKIPADMRLVQSIHLHIDESMLTGESMSIAKNVSILRGEKEIYEQTCMVFSGSFVVTGAGEGVVVATANRTEFGKLAQLAGESIKLKSPIQTKIDKLVQSVIIGISVLAAIVLIIQLAQGQDFIESFQFVLAFAVSAVPESLPIAITVVLAMGMKRMAKHKALVRNMQAIENIGLTTVIAADKTGTLTENKLTIVDAWSPNYNEPAFALQLAFSVNGGDNKTDDPLDVAVAEYLKKFKMELPSINSDAKLLKGFPFSYELAMSGNAWQFGDDPQVYLKGAPEKIIDNSNLSGDDLLRVNAELQKYAEQGYRVIAIGKIFKLADRGFKSLKKVISKTTKIEFLGLLAVADRIRPGTERAVEEAKRAGVRVRMITGDHSVTAYNIAKILGVADNHGQVYDSHKLSQVTPEKLAQIVGSARVYARVTPEAKHAILTELNKTDITAMTGDGVNDVPALTQAHVGIAMGSGSSIAKDASDIVLLDNNFRSIVTAIREGRTIVDNIKRMLIYLMATNAGEVLVTLIALLMGVPLPLVAVQILWINLATDTFLVVPLGVEPVRGNVMKRPPAKPSSPILDKYMFGQIVISALSIALIAITVHMVFLNLYNLESARSAVFLVLIIIQWVNAVAMRGIEPISKLLFIKNKAFGVAMSITIILQLIVLAVPDFRSMLHISELTTEIIVASLIGGAVSLVVLETYKLVVRKCQEDR